MAKQRTTEWQQFEVSSGDYLSIPLLPEQVLLEQTAQNCNAQVCFEWLQRGLHHLWEAWSNTLSPSQSNHKEDSHTCMWWKSQCHSEGQTRFPRVLPMPTVLWLWKHALWRVKQRCPVCAEFSQGCGFLYLRKQIWGHPFQGWWKWAQPCFAFHTEMGNRRPLGKGKSSVRT